MAPRARAAGPVHARSPRRVEAVLPGMPTRDGAGVRLTRIIGQPALRNLDPFLLLDRFHSDDPGAYIAGFPDHPHRGFETVTVMLHGRMRHRDSQGNAGLIQGGGVQWMTAGRGIVHSEMPEQSEGLMSGYQLWVNLPAREKMSAPAYQDLAPARIREERLGRSGSLLRVVAGQASGLAGPVRARPTQPLLLTLTLEDDQPFELDLPAGTPRSCSWATARWPSGRRRQRRWWAPSSSRCWGPVTGCGCGRPTAAAARWSRRGAPCASRSCSAGPS